MRQYKTTSLASELLLLGNYVAGMLLDSGVSSNGSMCMGADLIETAFFSNCSDTEIEVEIEDGEVCSFNGEDSNAVETSECLSTEHVPGIMAEADVKYPNKTVERADDSFPQ